MLNTNDRRSLLRLARDAIAARLEERPLTLPPATREPARIDVGRHGLMVEQGRRRGLLLPQVAAERSWTRAIFLAQTCLKAGLADDAWRQGAAVFTFEAYVFGEACP